MSYDFANILFSGPCNRACPWCIGKAMPARVNGDNLDAFPPRNLAGFIAAVNEHGVRDVVLTGTISDPQLYRHEARLVDVLRARLHPAARLSVHTNGVLALRKLEVLRRYDRACISFPSFDPERYRRLMGSGRPPDLAAIVARAGIPIKVSAVVTADNEDDLDGFLRRCQGVGVRRLVLRRLFGDHRPFPALQGLRPTGSFKGNPVFELDGMEVTLWRFDETRDMRSLNLFSDGTLGTSYLLTETRELAV